MTQTNSTNTSTRALFGKTQVRVDSDPLTELIERGKEITHKPDPTPNDSLYAVLGRLTEVEKELKALKRKLEIPTVA